MKAEWVKYKYDVIPNQMVCDRCETVEDMPPGSIRIGKWQAITDEFFKLHKKCKERVKDGQV